MTKQTSWRNFQHTNREEQQKPQNVHRVHKVNENINYTIEKVQVYILQPSHDSNITCKK